MFRPRFIGWLLVLVTLLAYLPALRNGFVNLDDPDYVTQNPTVQRGLSWPGVVWAFQGWHASNWHPLTWLSHMADCEVFHLNPVGHHFVSLLLHAANVGLLFWLWFRLTNAAWPSAMVAALFAWHPLHVESVAWVAERKDVLSTFFALLSLLAYVRHAQDAAQSGRPPSACPRSRFYWLAVGLFAAGLMAKPMLVTLPLVMLLLDFWPLPRRGAGKRLALEKWPFFALTAASCAVTLLAQRAEALAPLAKYSFPLRLANSVTAYADYLFKTIWPVKLAVFYPLFAPGWPVTLLAVLGLTAISLLVWQRIAAQPYLAVGWLWYLGTLVPVIGLVQVGDQALADRYTYFPLIGIFVAVVWAARDWGERVRPARRWLAMAAGLALVLCLGFTERQLAYWRDSKTLFTHALAVTADNAPARLNLGEALQEQNRPAEARVQYERALQLDPKRHEIYNNLGRLLSDAGKPAEALEYCRTAVALDPQSAKAHDGLGVVLVELGRYHDALAEFSAAARLGPRLAAPHFQAGRALLRLGRDADAVAEFHAALRLEPGDWTMVVYIARVLAADSQPSGRNGAEAFALAQRAVQAAGPQPALLDTLAMACAETGRFEDAAQWAREAIQGALAAGQTEDATNMQLRLGLYERHEPVRISF